MKKNSIAGFLAVAVASAGLLSGTNAFALTSAQADSLRTALAQTATPEMSARAADLVSAADLGDRTDVARLVVNEAVQRRPMLAASVVAAIAAKAPKVAAISAVEASLLQPKQIGDITKAATLAAPEQAGDIVAALCQRFPTQYNLIALAANEAAPQAGKGILNAVASSIPVLKPAIDRDVTGSAVDVSAAIRNAEQFTVESAASQKVSADQWLSLQASPSPAVSVPSLVVPGSATFVTLAPPSVGGPFQPNAPSGVISNTSTEIVPPGGSRNYSGP